MPSLAPLQIVSDVDGAAAMLHPARLRILHALARADSAAGLARRLGEPRQRLNYHLRALESAGLVEFVEERRRGNCTERIVRATGRTYVLDPAVLGPLAGEPDEGDDDATGRETDQLDRLSATYLVSVLARGVRELARLRRRAGARGTKLATLTLDTEVSLPSARAQARFAEELVEAVQSVVARHHDEQAPHGRRFRLVLASYPLPPAESPDEPVQPA
jgi:DNA-binding transcriptional ArsR family regulator